MMAAMGDDFLDVRTHGFARVAVAVPEVRVADPAFNAEAHLRLLERVHREGAHYALCPELGLSAYSCADLFFQETLLAASLAALGRVAEATAEWNLIVSVGMPLVVDDLLFNCAVTLFRGRVVAVAPKAFPPTYRECYERRWFHPAAHARAREITLLGERVPFGTDVLIAAPHLPGFVLHTDICEDLWTPVPPGTLAALAGATVLANLSASNVTVGKWEYRQELVRSSAAKNLAVQMYSAAGFGESTADLAWDGHGLIAERGEMIAETERFALHGSAVVTDVDLVALREDRMRQTSFGENAGQHARPFRTVVAAAAEERRSAAVYREFRRSIAPLPFVPADPAKRDARCREIFLIKATSLARRLLALPEDGRRVVIGISGGRDSTEALLFALASRERAIDLGTGDLSEQALGWATYGGDHMSHYGINAGVPKTLISELIRWAAEVIFKDEPEVARVLRAVLATPISPELLRLGPGGEIAQRSEELIGPYELHDFFLYYFLRFGFGPRRIARMAFDAFTGRYTVAEIRRWLLVFLERFFANQFKRDCVPDAPKVGSGGSLSPRGDWRMPSDASVAAWLAEARTIPESLERPRAVPRATRAASDRPTR